MVNSGEALLNVVIRAKRKMLNRLDQKGTWSGPEAPNSSGAAEAPPAERRDLTHTVTAMERGKPVVSPIREGVSQEELTKRRVEEEGASEGRPVIGRIGVEQLVVLAATSLHGESRQTSLWCWRT
jgi:hypothetical protein